MSDCISFKLLPIEVKAIRVNSKKMSMETFSQLRIDDYSNVDENIVIGWVNDNGQTVILWVDEYLRKRHIGIRRLDGEVVDIRAQKEYVNYIRNRFEHLFVGT